MRAAWPVLVGLVAASVVAWTPKPAAADELRDRQWHLAALQIPQAHQLSQGEGILVAVTDTGVDDRHRELAGAVISGKEFGEQPTGDG